MREQAIDIFGPDSFWWMVVYFLDFASLEHLSLLWNLFLNNLVNFSLQVIFLIDNFLVCYFFGGIPLHGCLFPLCNVFIVGRR